jgi:hypothetical protein
MAFFLALGYLIWSLLPHAHFLVHTHADGDLAHAHTHLSLHDLKLRNETLISANPENAPDAALERDFDPGAVGVEAASANACASTGWGQSPGPDRGLKATVLRHGHFTEEQNILAAGLACTSPEPATLPRASGNFPTLNPLLPYSGPTLARGPPLAA